MSRETALLIFQRNLVYGKVKTRLAATLGHDEAMKIYQQLLIHTQNITKEVAASKFIFYSDYKEDDDWYDEHQKKIQSGVDLGERMKNAFANTFQNGYRKAVIIGTDCPEISTQIMRDAFVWLDDYDVVIGAAADGGYYLLGMKQLYPQLFENIQWSTSKVFEETVQRCKHYNLSYALLPMLHDVDEEKDLIYMKTI